MTYFLFSFYKHNYQVLERAKEGESLEELRARTAAQFSNDQDPIVSKKRKQMADFDEDRMKLQRTD